MCRHEAPKSSVAVVHITIIDLRNEAQIWPTVRTLGDPPSFARAFDTTVLHDYSYDLFHPGLFEKSLIRS